MSEEIKPDAAFSHLTPSLEPGSGRQSDPDIKGDMTKFHYVGPVTIHVWQENGNSYFWLACPKAAEAGRVEFHERLMCDAREGIGAIKRIVRLERGQLNAVYASALDRLRAKLLSLAPGFLGDILRALAG